MYLCLFLLAIAALVIGLLVYYYYLSRDNDLRVAAADVYIANEGGGPLSVPCSYMYSCRECARHILSSVQTDDPHGSWQNLVDAQLRWDPSVVCHGCQRVDPMVWFMAQDEQFRWLSVSPIGTRSIHINPLTTLVVMRHTTVSADATLQETIDQVAAHVGAETIVPWRTAVELDAAHDVQVPTAVAGFLLRFVQTTTGSPMPLLEASVYTRTPTELGLRDVSAMRLLLCISTIVERVLSGDFDRMVGIDMARALTDNTPFEFPRHNNPGVARNVGQQTTGFSSHPRRFAPTYAGLDASHPSGRDYTVSLDRPDLNADLHRLLQMGITVSIQVDTLVGTIPGLTGLLGRPLPIVRAMLPDNMGVPDITVVLPADTPRIEGMHMNWKKAPDRPEISYQFLLSPQASYTPEPLGHVGLPSPHRLQSFQSALVDGVWRFFAEFDQDVETTVQRIWFAGLPDIAGRMYNAVAPLEPLPDKVWLRVRTVEGRYVFLENPLDSRLVRWFPVDDPASVVVVHMASMDGPVTGIVDDTAPTLADPVIRTWSSTIGGYIGRPTKDFTQIDIYLWGKAGTWDPAWFADDIKETVGSPNLYLTLRGITWTDSPLGNLYKAMYDTTLLPITRIRRIAGMTYVIVTIQNPRVMQIMRDRGQQQRFYADATYAIVTDTTTCDMRLHPLDAQIATGPWRVIENVLIYALYDVVGALNKNNGSEPTTYYQRYEETRVHRPINIMSIEHENDKGTYLTTEDYTDVAWRYHQDSVVGEDRLLVDQAYTVIVHPTLNGDGSTSESANVDKEISTFLLDGPMRNFYGYHVPVLVRTDSDDNNAIQQYVGSILTNVRSDWLRVRSYTAYDPTTNTATGETDVVLPSRIPSGTTDMTVPVSPLTLSRNGAVFTMTGDWTQGVEWVFRIVPHLAYDTRVFSQATSSAFGTLMDKGTVGTQVGSSVVFKDVLDAGVVITPGSMLHAYRKDRNLLESFVSTTDPNTFRYVHQTLYI